MISKQELESQANQVIAALKATVELQGDVLPMMYLHKKGDWNPVPLVPAGLADLMNSGKAKDVIFGLVRDIVRNQGIDAVIFATDTWNGETTEEGMKHYDTPEWKELHGFGFEKLVQRGWVKRSECFTVTAQNADDVLLIQQKYQRLDSGMVQLLNAERHWFDQPKFGGRLKMFGDLRWENLGSEGATKGADRT